MFKKILTSFSAIAITSSSFLVVACGSKINKDDNKPLNDNEFNKIVNNINDSKQLEEYTDLSFNIHSRVISKNQVLPSQLENNPKMLSVAFKGNNKGKIDVIVNGVSTKSGQNFNMSNREGTADVSLTFINRHTRKSITKVIKFSGLQINQGFDENGRIVGNQYAYFDEIGGFEKYIKLDLINRFDFDNKKYIDILQNSLHANSNDKVGSIKKIRDITITDDQINNFNKKAKEVKFDEYYNAALKGFTLPVYDSNGEVTGLKVNDGPETGKGPSVIDSLGRDQARTNGLARTIPNETYKNIATQTFQVSFRSPNLYEEEIEEAKEFIEKIGKWTDEQFKSYMAIQLNNLGIDFRYKNEQIELEIKNTDKTKYPGHIEQLTKNKQKLKEEYEKEKEKLEKFEKKDLENWQKKEIEEYEKKARDTANNSVKPVSGTMWILDHIISENGSNKNGKESTKFYFGTNSHVAKAIKNNLSSMSLTRIDKNVAVGQTLKLNALDPNFKTFNFSNNLKDAVNVIFHATDFIKKEQRPTEFLESSQKEKFKKVGIYADFAVIEIDFNKLLENFKSDNNNNSFWVQKQEKIITNEYNGKEIKDIVSDITNDYASLSDDKKVKFKSSSYLEENKYSEIERMLRFDPTKADELEKFKKLESLFVLGYPSAKDDYYFKQYEDDDQQAVKKHNFSLWVNSDQRYYNELSQKEGYAKKFPDYLVEKGESLSYQIGYRSFIDKPGLTDAFIASSRVGNKLYRLNGKEYFQYGLQIMPRFYAPSGGASGSSVRNNKNELIGVFHAANNSAKTGLAAVFRSPGYNYKGLFGKYNLVEYDLIYGGAEHQINSYRYSLYKKYKDKNVKTALFKNGLSREQGIPEEFKFKKTNFHENHDNYNE
ncbi:Ig-specific serine endopeptidase MIP [Mycoplasma capricolum]|uniref:Ig-specific serine endopeptidase MIP n=1 Tax=Mycoplasma capricolum TaxID=2095 RepID=UPI003DA2B1EA